MRPLYFLPFLLALVLPGFIHALKPNVDHDDHRGKGQEDILNMCLDSKNHKHRPGPEDSLHDQCTPWKERSCCTGNTSRSAHLTKMYNFDWNHCSHIRPLSPACRRHFVQDLCFYECSPNVGPWVVAVNNSFRSQRFYKVPLCQSDCTSWFNDCSEDLTCTDNWPRNMEWVKGVGNKCPAQSSCITFRQIYRTPKYFCETVWDHSWEVVGDDEHCMRMWFDPSGGNPNDQVAKWKAGQITSANSANVASKTMMICIFALIGRILIL